MNYSIILHNTMGWLLSTLLTHFPSIIIELFTQCLVVISPFCFYIILPVCYLMTFYSAVSVIGLMAVMPGH